MYKKRNNGNKYQRLDMPDSPTKTIWGEEQKSWLLRTLEESDARFKLLISATPMVGPDSASKRDNHADFNGYRHEGDAFFEWAKENLDTKELFIACGDRHWKYHAIHPLGFEEFSSGALVDANSIPGSFPGDEGTTDPDGEIQQPFHPQEPSGGFLLATVEPEGDSAVMRFEFFDESGRLLYSQERRR